MNQFVNVAYLHQIRLTGWAGEFPNPGSKLVTAAKMRMAVVRDALEPWEKYLLAISEGKKVDDIPGVRFAFETWTDG
jgi:hypothetical protein